MTKKAINQNAKYVTEVINSINPDFLFNDKPLKRVKNNKLLNSNELKNKIRNLTKLTNEINAIENCKLKENSNKLVFGNGNFNSPIMFIGGAPDENDESLGKPFEGDVGALFSKMLAAIDLERKDIYTCYTVNFRPPLDRKPSTSEIKRYAQFLVKHITIINPKIIILMGSTAMEAITGLNNKISNERGKWKETIIKNTNLPTLITFDPSFLIRFPENKKYSWDDLKKIRNKIKDLKIQIK